MRWKKFEHSTANVLDAKETRASGRFSHKGDSEGSTFFCEAKSHIYEDSSGIYTIAKEEVFKKACKYTEESGLFPIIAMELGTSHLYFVPIDLVDATPIGEIKQGRTQATIRPSDEFYYHTVKFYDIVWIILPKDEMRSICF